MHSSIPLECTSKNHTAGQRGWIDRKMNEKEEEEKAGWFFLIVHRKYNNKSV